MDQILAARQTHNRTCRILNGSTLKIIAMISMLIDHFAGTVLFVYLECVVQDQGQWNELYSCYKVLRAIGRTAFPIYCFLLCEGLKYTHSRARYAWRLLLFAGVSEIPFDLAIVRGDVLKGQNVFFTLLIGYLVIWGMEELAKRLPGYPMQIFLADGIIILAGSFLADLIRTDYGSKGVILIVILYLFRERRLLAGIFGYLSFIFEVWCFPAFLLIQFYNGKRGLPLKYVFYFFYPVHLFLLYLWIRTITG